MEQNAIDHDLVLNRVFMVEKGVTNVNHFLANWVFSMNEVANFIAVYLRVNFRVV